MKVPDCQDCRGSEASEFCPECFIDVCAECSAKHIKHHESTLPDDEDEDSQRKRAFKEIALNIVRDTR